MRTWKTMTRSGHGRGCSEVSTAAADLLHDLSQSIIDCWSLVIRQTYIHWQECKLCILGIHCWDGCCHLSGPRDTHPTHYVNMQTHCGYWLPTPASRPAPDLHFPFLHISIFIQISSGNGPSTASLLQLATFCVFSILPNIANLPQCFTTTTTSLLH